MAQHLLRALVAATLADAPSPPPTLADAPSSPPAFAVEAIPDSARLASALAVFVLDLCIIVAAVVFVHLQNRNSGSNRQTVFPSEQTRQETQSELKASKDKAGCALAPNSRNIFTLKWKRKVLNLDSKHVENIELYKYQIMKHKIYP